MILAYATFILALSYAVYAIGTCAGSLKDHENATIIWSFVK